MICYLCKFEIEDKAICKNCFNSFQTTAWNNLMKPDPYFDFKEQIKEFEFSLKNELNLINKNLEELNNTIKDFKIRSLKPKLTNK